MVCPPATADKGEIVPTTPPAIRVLMDDPIFRAYMKKAPYLPLNLRTGEPWQLWVNAGQGRWLTRTYASYRDVWPVFVKRFRTEDTTITSRRVFFAPPGEWFRVKVRKTRRPTPEDKSTTKMVIEWRWRQLFFWDAVDLHWCGRCRRPVYWMPLFADHHALRRLPAVSEEDNYRCVICGIRWIATPDISQMVRMEVRPS